jgi:hypothetical protein
VKDNNWIQTDLAEGWNTLLRLSSPLEPSSPRSGGRVRSSWYSDQTNKNIKDRRTMNRKTLFGLTALCLTALLNATPLRAETVVGFYLNNVIQHAMWG